MERLNRLLEHISFPHEVHTECLASSTSDELLRGRRSIPDTLNTKPKKYHHLRNVQEICEALRDNVRLSSMIPRVGAIPDSVLATLPPLISDFIIGMRSWAVMKDGVEHKNLRRSFPSRFMVYPLTREENAGFIASKVEILLDAVATREQHKAPGSREMDVMDDIARPLAIEILCHVLGLKHPTPHLRERLAVWSDHTADTGGRFPLQETVELYAEGVRFFLETFERVETAIARADFTEFSEQGLLVQLVRERKITDRHMLAHQCHMWVLGGYHNPANLTGLCVGHLMSAPAAVAELRARVAAAPADCVRLLHQVSTEVLRCHPPAHVIVRVATTDFNFHGRTIAHGDGVILHLEEAGRSMHPGAMDFFRPLDSGGTPHHLGFGHGHHRCMGGETGQVAAEVVMEKLLLSDIVAPSARWARLFRDLRLAKFDWEESGSFKEIHAIKLVF